MQSNRLKSTHYETVSATSIGSVVSFFRLTLLASLLIASLVGAGVIVRFSGEPSAEGVRYSKALAEQWAQKTGKKGSSGASLKKVPELSLAIS
jgi:hypothetical protein